MKRVLVISDLHAGHLVGLTPPGWQLTPAGTSPTSHREKWLAVQSACWDFYDKSIREFGPFDVVIANGDLIDGKGPRSGCSEAATADRVRQCEIAEECLNHIVKAFPRANRPTFYLTAGTAYHVSAEGEDWEELIARHIGAKHIGSHDFLDIEGVKFDVKHHISSSAIPHGRHTAIARDRLWNLLWSERGLQPKANVFIRSHVHYLAYCGGPDWLALTTPALQGYGTKYGARQCSGIVDFGMVVFECDKGSWKWQPIISLSPALRARLLKA